MKTNTSIPVHITPHHLTLSPALIAKVTDEIGSLARYGERILRADVVLRLHHSKSHGRVYGASARLSLPGGDIHVRAKHSNLYKAISLVESRLARRLRKRKTRSENRVHAGRFNNGVTSAAHLETFLLAA